jgi:hypothetical protein
MISISYLFEAQDLRKLKTIIAYDSGGKKNIKPEHSYDDLGYSPYDKMETASSIHNNITKLSQDEYDHYLKNIHTVKDTIDFIKKVKNKKDGEILYKPMKPTDFHFNYKDRNSRKKYYV